jgi:hypothetical protein
MRNARQELFIHINALQNELERLTLGIEKLLVAAPDREGVRRMPWQTPALPAQVVAALLEGYRDDGWDLRVDARGRDMELVISPNREAVPLPITAG